MAQDDNYMRALQNYVKLKELKEEMFTQLEMLRFNMKNSYEIDEYISRDVFKRIEEATTILDEKLDDMFDASVELWKIFR